MIFKNKYIRINGLLAVLSTVAGVIINATTVTSLANTELGCVAHRDGTIEGTILIIIGVVLFFCFNGSNYQEVILDLT